MDVDAPPVGSSAQTAAVAATPDAPEPIMDRATATATLTSTRAQTFAGVMVEPCMAVMLGCTDVADRVRCITVATSWLRAVQRPAIWADCEWKSGDSAHFPCEWLRQCIGCLQLDSRIDLSAAATLAAFTQFSRLQRLTIAGGVGVHSGFVAERLTTRLVLATVFAVQRPTVCRCECSPGVCPL